MAADAAASFSEDPFDEEEAVDGADALESSTNNNNNNNNNANNKAPIVAAETPSYRQLLVFTATTVLIWLSEPLLSLVDTTVVGLTQGSDAVVQLASLGPATTLLDSLLYLTYFLAIATTNQIAASRATRNTRQLQVTTSHTLGVAVVLGVVLTAVVWLFGQGWLLRMAGASATPQLVTCATDYACIRAAAAVPAVVGMVAQSVCLATLDTRTPVIAVASASLCNVVGDVLLAPVLGVRGAALATAASNVVATAILLRAVRRQMATWRAQDADTTAPPVPFISWPDRTSLRRLLKLVGPIFFVICAKICCYSAMTLRCTDFGVTALAAHGIMMRLWFFFGCFGDSVSQTAQSFLPATFYPQPDAKKFRTVLVRLLGISAGVGLMNWQLSDAVLQFGGGLFTNNSAILTLMRDNRRFIGTSLLLHPFIMCLEGTVIAARDFATLSATYAVTLVVHFGILKYFCPSFPAVWRTFFLFQSIRLVNFSLHVWPKQRMAREKEATGAVAASG
jgi:putative MATE family efflux protein